MNAEFQWWLLIVGAVIGGALVYLVLADMRSDDGDDGLDEPWPESTLAGQPRPGGTPRKPDGLLPGAGPTSGSGADDEAEART